MQEERQTTHASKDQQAAHAPAPKDGSEKQGKNQLILTEERETGAVGWKVYVSYLKATGSWLWPLLAGTLLITEQGATVSSSLILGFWSSQEFPGWSNGNYMGLYAGMLCLVNRIAETS